MQDLFTQPSPRYTRTTRYGAFMICPSKTCSASIEMERYISTGYTWVVDEDSSNVHSRHSTVHYLQHMQNQDTAGTALGWIAGVLLLRRRAAVRCGAVRSVLVSGCWMRGAVRLFTAGAWLADDGLRR